MTPEDRDFAVLKRQILRDAGFDCSPYNDKFLKRRFDIRMRANNVRSYREYAGLLERDPPEYTELIEALTIPVTEFFRDPDVFEDFEKTIIPKLIADKKRKKQKIIRVWSAGCASGEEAYSIAMSMNEFLGPKLDDFILSIQGTDIDDGALAKAEKGEYTPKKVKKVPGVYLRKYFSFDGEKYKIDEGLKRLVKFEKRDLISGKPHQYFDVIFCRNVLIYFSREAHKKVHMRLYDALNDDGVLIVGKTELLHGKTREMFVSVGEKGIYQKPSRFRRPS
jgi:chemotaxis protein methyltransferase CheR